MKAQENDAKRRRLGNELAELLAAASPSAAASPPAAGEPLQCVGGRVRCARDSIDGKYEMERVRATVCPRRYTHLMHVSSHADCPQMSSQGTAKGIP